MAKVDLLVGTGEECLGERWGFGVVVVASGLATLACSRSILSTRAWNVT